MSTDHNSGCSHCQAAYLKGIADGYRRGLADCVRDVIEAIKRIGCDDILGQILDEIRRQVWTERRR